MLLLVPHVGHLALSVLDRTARGRLPLTKSSARRIDRAGWRGVLLIAVAFGLWAGIAVIGITVGPHSFDTHDSIAAGLLLAGGLVSLGAGAGVLLSGRRSIGPQGVVRRTFSRRGPRVVDIWNLHPSFVAATIAIGEPDEPQPDYPQ